MAELTEFQKWEQSNKTEATENVLDTDKQTVSDDKTVSAVESTEAEPGAVGSETEADEGSDDSSEQSEESSEEHEAQAGADAGDVDRPAKKKGGWQRKIDKLEREIAMLRGAQGAGVQQATQPVVEAADRPKLEDYPETSDYIKAEVAWQRKQERAAEQQQQVQQTFETRQAEFSKTAKDYFEVMEAANVQINPATLHAVQTWESGPAIAYHLAKNPDIANHIAGLDAVQTGRELARLEAQIEAKRSPAITTKPAAQTVKPVPSIGGVRTVADPGKMPDPKDFKAWYEWRQKNPNAQL